MNIGNRNRLIEIWKPTGAVDGANEPLPDAWEFHKSRWAEIKGESGMASIRAASSADGIVTPLNRRSFRINHTPDITIDMQVREHSGTVRSQIVAVRHDDANREWTDVITETGGANG